MKHQQASENPEIALSIKGHFKWASNLLFENLDLPVPIKQWTCLLGSSGVGKSTLLRLMCGLETGGIFTGDITWNDKIPTAHRSTYMAQSDMLLPWLSVLDNVTIGAKLRKQKPDISKAKLLIEKVGLNEHTDKKPDQLSGGMRQRTALARTLMEDSPVIFLDEPFSALDAKTRAEMQELSYQLFTERTVVLVTHDPAEAARLGQNIYVMKKDAMISVNAPSLDKIRPIDSPITFKVQSELFAILREQTS